MRRSGMDMAIVLFMAPVSGSVPWALANPVAMIVGLIVLAGVFLWLRST
jgi:xanthine/uracil/vitamin C permease (AzgA family)